MALTSLARVIEVAVRDCLHPVACRQAIGELATGAPPSVRRLPARPVAALSRWLCTAARSSGLRDSTAVSCGRPAVHDSADRWERGLEVLEHIKVRDEDLAEELAAEADLAATDQFGSTALILAARAGLQRLCGALVGRRGVEVNVQNHFGSTALICAATNGHLEVCELLLAHGADVHRRTRLGGTALGKAAAAGQEAVCRRLLAAGATLDVRTKLGDTAVDLARKAGHEELSFLLEAAAASPPARP